MVTLLILLIIILLFGLVFYRTKELKNNFSTFRISDLWNWMGEISGGPYLILGLILFYVKHNLDCYVYYSLYGTHIQP